MEVVNGIDLFAQQLAEKGVSTADVEDGRIFYFTVEFLKSLIQVAHDKGTEQVAIMIRKNLQGTT